MSGTSQGELDLPITGIDLGKFVEFEAAIAPMRYRVAASRTCGTALGVIRLKHARGYEVLLRHDDGTITSHNPHSLFPEK